MDAKRVAIVDDSWDDTEIENEDYDRVLFRTLLGTEPTVCGLILRLLLWGCWSFCCPPWPPCMIHKLAFGYRVKSSYEFLPLPNGGYRLKLSQDAKRLTRFSCKKNPQLWIILIRQLIRNLRCFYIKYGRKKRLACALFRRPSQQRPVLLFSKSRFQDIGLAIFEVAALIGYLNVDLLVYDYSGYGCSNGKLSEKHLRRNVECVYEYMTKTLGIRPQQIIAMGSSLGTVATIHLAAKFPVGAVILEGCFMSAMRKCWPRMKKTCACWDRLVNLERIHEVKCPTLFVHGSADKMFPPEHMRRLRERCPGAATVEPLVIAGGGHQGFEQHPEYWARLESFLAEETEVIQGAVHR